MAEQYLIEKFNAGSFIKESGYSFFLPEKINRPWKWEDASLNTLLEEASLKLGHLNSFARLVPNIDLFIQLHVTMEAVISSRIEGTQTNIDEALMAEEDIDPQKRDDWQEVQNYTQAINQAIQELEHLPISTRLLCQTHKTLMQGVRGEEKRPGQFRKSQNWIGGASLQDAVFIPPADTYIGELMGDLEKFLHNEEIDVPDLVRIGMAHYQFETIHPFLDGNGRIGRLLITLYLVSNQILDQPLLYLSSFFEKDKGLYYDNLMRVREKNDLLHWLKYFLTGVKEAAATASDTLGDILELKDTWEERIRANWGRRTDNALILLQELFRNPFVNIKKAQKVCDLSPKAAGDLVKSFEKAGILHEITGHSRNRMYMFDQYLQLFR